MTAEQIREQARHVTALYAQGKIAKDAGEALLRALEAGAQAIEGKAAAAEGAELVAALRAMPAPIEGEDAVVTVSRQLRDGSGKPMVSLAVGSRAMDVAFGPEETVALPERFGSSGA